MKRSERREKDERKKRTHWMLQVTTNENAMKTKSTRRTNRARNETKMKRICRSLWHWLCARVYAWSLRPPQSFHFLLLLCRLFIPNIFSLFFLRLLSLPPLRAMSFTTYKLWALVGSYAYITDFDDVESMVLYLECCFFLDRDFYQCRLVVKAHALSDRVLVYRRR